MIVALLGLISCKKSDPVQPVKSITTNTVVAYDYSGQYKDTCSISCLTITLEGSSSYTILGINPLVCNLQTCVFTIKDSVINSGSSITNAYVYNGITYDYSANITLIDKVFYITYTNEYYINTSNYITYHKLTKL